MVVELTAVHPEKGAGFNAKDCLELEKRLTSGLGSSEFAQKSVVISQKKHEKRQARFSLPGLRFKDFLNCRKEVILAF
jgi:hypothetical protein